MPKPPSKIRSTLYTLRSTLSPYWDIILFVVALLAADGVWKLCVSGNEMSVGAVRILGLDASAFFTWMSQAVAHQVYAIVSFFRDTAHIEGNHLFFDSGSGTHIVWSCTPIKQSWIWLIIILAARGKWLHKLWFIPAGWVLIYGINLLRVAAINLIVEFHPDLFELMHTYVFKYAFYGCMFLLWLIWTTCFGKSTNITEPKSGS